MKTVMVAFMLSAVASHAQAVLPSAPVPSLTLFPQAAAPAPSAGDALTRTQAEQLALKNNPRVSVSQLLALAQHQGVREARAAELPTANAAITAEKALDGSRISAASLTASRLFTHAGAGGDFTQLITDFGRTHNLVLTQKLQEQAAKANQQATREEIVLAADQAFYDALTAQSVLKVARQTVNTRQATQSQVNQMTQNKLKSTLDLSFANVNLSQSKLLQLDAQNNADATMATLDAVLGLDHPVTYQLVEEATAINAPPADVRSTDSGRPGPAARSAIAHLWAAVCAEICPRAMGPASAFDHCRRYVRNRSHTCRSVLYEQLVGRDRGKHEHPHL